MSRRLEGQVAVITGAASGIGAASVARFLAEGARVVANDIRGDGLARMREALPQDAAVRLLEGDVTLPETNEALVAAALDTFGDLDIVFANAGGAPPREMATTALETYRADLALNLDAFWHAAQAALPHFLARERGCFIATSSGAGLGAVPGFAPYGAAKAGVISLARSLAADYGARGVRANAISPGPMEAPGVVAYVESLPGGRVAYEAQLPLRRLGRPEEIAAAAVFLASEDASYVSGVCLPVDGATSGRLWNPVLSE